MHEHTRQLLEEIGQQLDRHVFPMVRNGVLVTPGQPVISFNSPGKEQYHARKGKRRSTTEPRTGIVGWQGPSGGCGAAGRSPSEATPFIGPVVARGYPEALSPVCEAYPGTLIWEQEGGFWMYSESALLPGLDWKVAFLTGVSTRTLQVKGWGFRYHKAIGYQWIGPRHTNFPDGSICAYDPTDGTWGFGGSLIELLDIYTLWALRHLHCDAFGRWPGPQSVPHVYERLLEFSDDELCGCGTTLRRYADCCKVADFRKGTITEAVRFGCFSRWSLRYAPPAITRFLLARVPPPLNELI